MAYDFSFLWVWALVVLIIGGATGWLTSAKSAPGRRRLGWPLLAMIVFALGLVAAGLHWLPGRPGFWLETALFCFASFVVGCLLGGWLKSATASRAAPAAVAAAPTPTIEAGPAAAIAAAAAPTPAGKPAAERPFAAKPIAAAPSAPPPKPAVRPARAPASPAPAAASAEPAAMGPVPGEEKHPGARPLGLVAARGGKADDLQLIKGVGPQNERRLHALGVWHWAQIAAWTHDNALWVGSYLAFPGRIERERWIAQARALAHGGQTAFAARVARSEVAGKTDQPAHDAPGAAGRPKTHPRH